MFHFPNKISETVGGSRLAQYFMTKAKFGGGIIKQKGQIVFFSEERDAIQLTF